jgi:hypothetical protein
MEGTQNGDAPRAELEKPTDAEVRIIFFPHDITISNTTADSRLCRIPSLWPPGRRRSSVDCGGRANGPVCAPQR